jgi:hypothetical protein
MDWKAAIERNREALKRILAMLVAMARLVETQPPPDASRRPPDKGEVNPESPVTLPRHLHRAVLRLLRPAEAAARRLIIAAARGLVVPPPAPPRMRKPKPMSIIVRDGKGTGIVLPPGVHPSAILPGFAPPRPRSLALPLFDPLPGFGGRRRPVARCVPRILTPGTSVPFPIAAPPSPHDPIDATRLALRLAALGRVLDDLPREARRFARWRYRAAAGAQIKQKLDAEGAQDKGHRDAAGAQNTSHSAGPFRRVWPLRPGRPPGWRRRPDHEVHDILDVAHGLAIWALERPDTS